MEKIKFTIATQELIDKMKGKMREQDETECRACSGDSADHSLQYGFETSELCWVMLYDDEPVVCFGCGSYTPLFKDIGVPWALATNLIEDERRAKLAWARIGKNYVSKMLDRFYYLENYVDARNTKSLNWLNWCGFTVASEPQPYGVSGLPFYKFYKFRED